MDKWERWQQKIEYNNRMKVVRRKVTIGVCCGIAALIVIILLGTMIGRLIGGGKDKKDPQESPVMTEMESNTENIMTPADPVTESSSESVAQTSPAETTPASTTGAQDPTRATSAPKPTQGSNNSTSAPKPTSTPTQSDNNNGGGVDEGDPDEQVYYPTKEGEYGDYQGPIDQGDPDDQ